VCDKGLTADILLAVRKKLSTMNNKLYVGGLSYDTSEDELKNHFGGAGTVTSASIIMDRETNRSRGFGFVEMSSEEEANKAIEMFNEKEFAGRNLTVNIAKPKTEGGDRPRRSFGGGGAGGSRGGFGGRRNSY
jgi:RNA recognition motif-containing protein